MSSGTCSVTHAFLIFRFSAPTSTIFESFLVMCKVNAGFAIVTDIKSPSPMYAFDTHDVWKKGGIEEVRADTRFHRHVMDDRPLIGLS